MSFPILQTMPKIRKIPPRLPMFLAMDKPWKDAIAISVVLRNGEGGERRFDSAHATQDAVQACRNQMSEAWSRGRLRGYRLHEVTATVVTRTVIRYGR